MLSRKVPHARLIARQIDDVRAAIDAGNLLSALALALTFPDVLGQVMYSNAGKKHDGRNIGVRYAKWFDEYVGAEYRAPEEPGSRELKSYFTGRMCWKLRCAYLHEGKSDNKYPYDPSDDQEGLEHDFELELALHACDAIGDMTESTRPNLVKRHVRIDIGSSVHAFAMLQRSACMTMQNGSSITRATFLTCLTLSNFTGWIADERSESRPQPWRLNGN